MVELFRQHATGGDDIVLGTRAWTDTELQQPVLEITEGFARIDAGIELADELFVGNKHVRALTDLASQIDVGCNDHQQQNAGEHDHA